MFLTLVLWYLTIAVVGWLVFPLAYRLLSFLPDRGLAFARPLGLLLWGYAYWLLVSLGVLQNDSGGVLFALLLVGALSLWRLWKGDGREIAAWLRGRGRLVLVTEALFLVLFAFMAVVRAANPDATGTEKPMELAFINAILRSPAFPPADPWLSGYAISYYYFGYIMVAALARISGASGAVAFNLALASWFALTGLAAYGLLYNLLAARGRQIARGVVDGVGSTIAPLLAPLFVLIVSNLEGILEVLHAGNLFWKTNPGGQATSSFWQWLNIQELTSPPAPPFDWVPKRPGGIWWWRASRVLQDFAQDGSSREIIDEFPAFSYLLGDLHPHVLAMPFTLLAIALALNVYLRLRASSEAVLRIEQWPRTLEFWLAALVLGGLSFLNTWDFPIYLALFAAAAALARLAWTGWRWNLLLNFFEVAISLALAGVVLYLPFYLGFASQANGILPSLIFFTRGTYFWIMFGALLLPVVMWLVWLFLRWRRAGRTPDLLQGLLIATALIAGLWLLSYLDGVRLLRADPGLLGHWGAKDAAPMLQAALSKRLASPGTWLSLLGVLALSWALIQVNRCTGGEGQPIEKTGEEPEADIPASRADPFVLLLIALGVGLVLFPEFFYLRDQFGWRMNTIFKFYFQVWVVWAIAAGYASAILLGEMASSKLRVVFAVGLSALLAMALVYPFFGFLSRTNDFNPQTWTLDGSASMAKYSPDEMEAIRWLQAAPYGVVAEAVGGSYTGYARVSTLSGLPAVLGWPGHESQWRGGEKEKGSREADIALLFKTRRWEQASEILKKYNIRYVYLGDLERAAYRANDSLFKQDLKPVFQNGTVTIYEVPGYNSSEAQAVQP